MDDQAPCGRTTPSANFTHGANGVDRAAVRCPNVAGHEGWHQPSRTIDPHCLCQSVSVHRVAVGSFCRDEAQIGTKAHNACHLDNRRVRLRSQQENQGEWLMKLGNDDLRVKSHLPNTWVTLRDQGQRSCIDRIRPVRGKCGPLPPSPLGQRSCTLRVRAFMPRTEVLALERNDNNTHVILHRPYRFSPGLMCRKSSSRTALGLSSRGFDVSGA